MQLDDPVDHRVLGRRPAPDVVVSRSIVQSVAEASV